jgi:hypothetical protein
VGAILLGAFGGLFYLLTRGQQRASRVIRRVASRIRFLDAERTTSLVERLAARFAVLTEDRALTRRAVGWAAANWLLDAASLWVFVAAFSHFISPVDLLMAYGLANILAAIPITPGGLGVVEFVLVSMITGFGPTAGEALSGVLAYRAVNFWLPIPFGGLAYASLEFERRLTFLRFREFLQRQLERPRAGVARATHGPAADRTARDGLSPDARTSDASVTGGGAQVGRQGAGPTHAPAPAPAPAAAHRSARRAVRRGDAGVRPEPVFGSDPAG